MADRRRRVHGIELEYLFDRLLPTKLEQAYAVLAPDRVRRTGQPTGLTGEPHEDSSHLRPCLLGPAEGRKDHSQQDGDPSGVCPQGRLPSAG